MCYLNDVASDLKVSEWHHRRKLSCYLFPFPGTKQLQHLGTPAFHTSTERRGGMLVWNGPVEPLTESCVVECFLSITGEHSPPPPTFHAESGVAVASEAPSATPTSPAETIRILYFGTSPTTFQFQYNILTSSKTAIGSSSFHYIFIVSQATHIANMNINTKLFIFESLENIWQKGIFYTVVAVFQRVNQQHMC